MPQMMQETRDSGEGINIFSPCSLAPSSSLPHSLTRLSRRAQSTLEYAAVVAITVAALLTMQVYIKRGLAGRMRTSADAISEQQYDPRHTTSTITMSQVNDVSTTSTLHTDRDVGNGVVVDVLENTTTINHDRTDRSGSETVGSLTKDLWE